MAFDTVRECLISALDLSATEAQQVARNTTAADLQKWDSLAHLMLITQLEERVSIQWGNGAQPTLHARPRAKELAEQHGVSLEQVAAVGVTGSIKEADVHRYLEVQQGAAETPPAAAVGAALPPALGQYVVEEGE